MPAMQAMQSSHATKYHGEILSTQGIAVSIHGIVNFLPQTQIFFGMIDDKEAWRFDFRLRRNKASD